MEDSRNWVCRQCHWTGAIASMSDRSYVGMTFDGQLIDYRPHDPLCPKCFALVRREERLPTGTYRRITVAA